MKRICLYTNFIFLSLIILINCGPSPQTLKLIEQSKQLFGTTPSTMPGAENDTPNLIELGRALYFEKRLSSNNSQSCNSCHLLEKDNDNGVDNQPTSKGALGKKGDRNTPTVWNAGFHMAQFWDGRAKDLEEQATMPIFNPIEMNLKDEKELIDKLKVNPVYVDKFSRAFVGKKFPINLKNAAIAISAFERTLITKDRFDEFMKGNYKALTKKEQTGLKTFIKVGCTTCHNGPMLGARMYQKTGLITPYENTKDLGRFNITKEETDKFIFKVPSLRNIANTYPYFHDGKISSLEDAVKKMAKMQLNIILSDKQLDYIVIFLNSLNKTNTINDL